MPCKEVKTSASGQNLEVVLMCGIALREAGSAERGGGRGRAEGSCSGAL